MASRVFFIGGDSQGTYCRQMYCTCDRKSNMHKLYPGDVRVAQVQLRQGSLFKIQGQSQSVSKVGRARYSRAEPERFQGRQGPLFKGGAGAFPR